MIALLVGGIAILVVGLAVGLRLRPRRIAHPRVGRVLVPFTGGALDETVLAAAIRIARAETATLVPAYLIVVPLEQPEDAPMQQQVGVAMPLLEAVEHAALRAGVPVDARIESGRTPIHALRRLWEAERFDRIIVPAPAARGDGDGRGGFAARDLAWMLGNAPSETLILRPDPSPAVRENRRPRPAARVAATRRSNAASPPRRSSVFR
jgi:hypothetical protein